MATVSQFKGGHQRIQKEPKEGTTLRRIYDLLVENEGEVVPIHYGNFYKNNGKKYPGSALSAAIRQLNDFYNLDIRLIRRGSKIRGSGLYMLVGYWDGPTYVDCLANKRKEQV